MPSTPLGNNPHKVLRRLDAVRSGTGMSKHISVHQRRAVRQKRTLLWVLSDSLTAAKAPEREYSSFWWKAEVLSLLLLH